MIEKLFNKFKLEGDYSDYGLKTKEKGILIKSIADLDKTINIAQDEFLQDDDYYDKNIDSDNLILVYLAKEAKRAIR